MPHGSRSHRRVGHSSTAWRGHVPSNARLHALAVAPADGSLSQGATGSVCFWRGRAQPRGGLCAASVAGHVVAHQRRRPQGGGGATQALGCQSARVASRARTVRLHSVSASCVLVLQQCGGERALSGRPGGGGCPTWWEGSHVLRLHRRVPVLSARFFATTSMAGSRLPVRGLCWVPCTGCAPLH